MHFWLHHTWATGSALAERVRQGEVGGVTHVQAARLGCKVPWLGPGGPILALAAWTGLEDAIVLPCRVCISSREGCLVSEWVFDNRKY